MAAAFHGRNKLSWSELKPECCDSDATLLICRNEYEQSIVLQAIKETALKDAFELLCASLDQPVDEFEAVTLLRRM